MLLHDIYLFACTVLLHLTIAFCLRHAARVAERTENFWDDSLIYAAKLPAPALVWLISISIALKDYNLPAINEYLPQGRNIAITFCIGWFLIRLINDVVTNMIKEEGASEAILGGRKVAKTFVLGLGALSVMQTLNFSISAILAFGGMGGIALGFALRDVISNVFGGLVVHLDRPFSIGENVSVPDKKIEGTVEYIGWRQTRIRLQNKVPIYVPNSIFTSSAIENSSRMTHRPINEVLHVTVDSIDKLDKITAEIETMIRNNPQIDSEQNVIAVLSGFTDFSANLTVQCLSNVTCSAQFHKVKHEIMLNVARIITANGAKLAVRS